MYRLGIDLGGTNIVAGLCDENYKIVAKASCKTNVPRPESDICDSMAEVAKKACEKAGVSMDEVESIGIGVPGAVNPKTGVIEYSANLHFHNWEVSKMMNERLGRISRRLRKGRKERGRHHPRHRRRRRHHYQRQDLQRLQLRGR